MKLLNTYEDRDEAEAAAEKISGNKRLASERDDTTTIYNLFGTPSWGNLHRLGMYRLTELQELLERREAWGDKDKIQHADILNTLKIAAKNYSLEIPNHWL
ncbi:hypothetical protein [Stutzerimonas stutzeri]|uniref:hypothetical protein n=1 Tax=Stutzerimonas stutzeri TaxID=316 RepID=UPI0009EA13DA|nr:hypothetical protein [Stutzerimonas stutzeri]